MGRTPTPIPSLGSIVMQTLIVIIVIMFGGDHASAATIVTFDPDPGWINGNTNYAGFTWQGFNYDLPGYGVGGTNEIILMDSGTTASITKNSNLFTPVSVAAYNWNTGDSTVRFRGYRNGVLIATTDYAMPVRGFYDPNPGVVYTFSGSFVAINRLEIDPTPNGYNSGGFDNFVYNEVINTVPTFIGAVTTLTVAAGSGAADIRSLLHVSDMDTFGTLTWSQNTAPAHGYLAFSSATAASGGTDITPGGTITYTPNSNYSGSDSFTVQVSDGIATSTRTITVNINPTLTVVKTGSGTGTVTATGCTLIWTGANGSCSTVAGTAITLAASAGSFTTFAGWSGGSNSATACSGTGNCSFDLNQTSAVTANFPLIQYTVSASAGSKGSISPSGNQSVDHGTTATYTIIPVAGYRVVTPVGGTCGGSYTGSPTDTGSGISYTTIAITADCSVTAAFEPVACGSRPSGLLAWWKGQGNTADSAGSHSGSWTGTAAYAAGEVGQAFNFSGSNSYVTVGGTSSDFDFTNKPFSIAAWIRIASGAVGGAAGYMSIFDRSRPGYADGYRLDYSVTQHNFRLLGTSVLTVPATLLPDTWYHVAAVSQNGTGSAIYLNGVQIGSTGAHTTNNWSVTPRIGDCQISGDAPFNGRIDELQIYNRALNSSEVQSMYSAGSGGVCDYTLTVNKAGTGSGAVTADACSLNWNGPIGSCGVVSGTPVVLTAAATSALFDGWSTGSGSAAGCSGTGPCSFTATADSAVTATFTSYTVTPSVGSGGSIMPANPVPLAPGSSTTFTIKPAAGYRLVTPVGGTCGGSFTGNPYDEVNGVVFTTAAVTADCTLEATFASFTCGQRPPNMLAWLRGEGNAYDSISNHTGTETNVGYAAGRAGQAFSFSGSSSYVTIDLGNSGSAFNFTGTPFTISSWIRIAGTFPGNYEFGAIFDRQQPYTGNGYRLDYSPAFNRLRLLGTTMLEGTTSLAQGTWYHITAVSNGGGSVLYVNGAAIATGSHEALNDYPVAPRIGDSTTNGEAPFNGQIDEVQVYNRALTGGEVLDLYQYGSHGLCTPPTLTVNITNPGTVTSSNGNGTSYSCLSTSFGSSTCIPVAFNEGDTVTLSPTGSNSAFSSWSGDLTGGADPGVITMDNNKSVTAAFTPDPAKVRIDGSAVPYYSIGPALDACSLDGTVRARDIEFTGDVTMNSSHILKLRGGFSDNGFTDGSQSSYSTIIGWLRIQSGRLTAERLKIKP